MGPPRHAHRTAEQDQRHQGHHEAEGDRDRQGQAGEPKERDQRAHAGSVQVCPPCAHLSACLLVGIKRQASGQHARTPAVKVSTLPLHVTAPDKLPPPCTGGCSCMVTSSGACCLPHIPHTMTSLAAPVLLHSPQPKATHPSCMRASPDPCTPITHTPHACILHAPPPPHAPWANHSSMRGSTPPRHPPGRQAPLPDSSANPARLLRKPSSTPAQTQLLHAQPPAAPWTARRWTCGRAPTRPPALAPAAWRGLRRPSPGQPPPGGRPRACRWGHVCGRAGGRGFAEQGVHSTACAVKVNSGSAWYDGLA